MALWLELIKKIWPHPQLELVAATSSLFGDLCYYTILDTGRLLCTPERKNLPRSSRVKSCIHLALCVGLCNRVSLGHLEIKIFSGWEESAMLTVTEFLKIQVMAGKLQLHRW